jgi:hypothetical protein
VYVEVVPLPTVKVTVLPHNPTANNAASTAMVSRKEDEETIGDLTT